MSKVMINSSILKKQKTKQNKTKTKTKHKKVESFVPVQGKQKSCNFVPVEASCYLMLHILGQQSLNLYKPADFHTVNHTEAVKSK